MKDKTPIVTHQGKISDKNQPNSGNDFIEDLLLQLDDMRKHPERAIDYMLKKYDKQLRSKPKGLSVIEKIKKFAEELNNKKAIATVLVEFGLIASKKVSVR
jgi:hypothetical protein